MIQVTGLTGVVTDLLSKSQKAYGEAMNVSWKAADAAAATARDLAPSGPGEPEHLKDTIRAGTTGDPKPNSVISIVGPTARHAPYVYYGTYKDQPQPEFLDKALSQMAGQVYSGLSAWVGKL